MKQANRGLQDQQLNLIKVEAKLKVDLRGLRNPELELYEIINEED